MDRSKKAIHRIVAQTNSITISAETKGDVTVDEAKEIAEKEVLLETGEYQKFVVLPITSKERWEDKTINFCPRCGANLDDYGLEQEASFDCMECDVSVDARIITFADESVEE